MSATLYDLTEIRGNIPEWGVGALPLDRYLSALTTTAKQHTHSGSGAEGTKIDGANLKGTVAATINGSKVYGTLGGNATIPYSAVNDMPSFQVSIGGPTAVALSSDQTEYYTIMAVDRVNTTIEEVGMTIGHQTIVDAGAPATSYIQWGFWNMTKATNVIALATLLGIGGSTQILPDTYQTLGTTKDINVATCAADDVLALKLKFTNKGAGSGLTRPIVRVQYDI